MSRVGQAIINIPEGVEVKQNNNIFSAADRILFCLASIVDNFKSIGSNSKPYKYRVIFPSGEIRINAAA